MSARMQILGKRVDALVLAFRVTLDPLFVDALRVRGGVAYKHGRAAFYWRHRVPKGMRPVGERGASDREALRLGGLRARWASETEGATEEVRALWGELKYSRQARCWTVTNQPYFMLRVDAQAPGGVDRQVEYRDELGRRVTHSVHDAGWTIEIKFYAEWLAEVGLDAALREGEAIASLCGEVHEQRLRRIDLCADVAGWEIGEEDVRRLVKRPRARWQKEYGGVAVDPDGRTSPVVRKPGRATKKERAEEERAQDFGKGALERRQITGVSVGRGGAMMTRIYDKRCELELPQNEEKRANEEARWRAAGWNGMAKVTRVEFQIRGSVIAEFGIRDPSRAKIVEWGISDKGRPVVVAQRDAVDEDGCVLGLVDRLDYLWRSCLDWVRLVEPATTKSGKLRAASLLEDDARWALLRTVQFASARAPSPIKRFRVRQAATAAMALGVALSQAARDGELDWIDEEHGDALESEEAAEAALVERVGRLMTEQAAKVIEAMRLKYGGAVGAFEHFAIRSNAALVRFKERRRADADLATGPPHGGGPRPPPSSGRRGHDSAGGRERGRLVA